MKIIVISYPLLTAVAFGVTAGLTWSAPWWADVIVSLLVWATLDRIQNAGPPS
jgi:hypothetical protein